MSHIFDDRFDGRERERRDIRADQMSHADTAGTERRGFDDRRSDFEWRYSWLRARICRALKD